MDTDVLIVGAGPTGLMLANQLARRGVRVVVIERNPGPATETRALGVQARTLEIYSKLGVAARAVQLGKPGIGANLWASGKRMGRVGFGETGRELTPYPYLLVLGQDDNEKILGERLPDFGVQVQWNTELLGIAQDAEQVTAALKMPDGSVRMLSAAYVAGCDGAHSAVRKLCAIDFPGAPYEHSFFVADMKMTGPMVPDEVNIYLWRTGFHLFFPMRGVDHWRVVGIIPKHLRSRQDLKFKDVQQSLLDEAGQMRFESCSWFSTYRIHHRRAAHFRRGRCFLLGDAAHIHSPVGAQGMNTGLQDAYNLGWKLAAVVRDEAAPELLDTYEAERIPVAENLLNTTDRGFRLLVSDHWLAGLLRTQVVARIAQFAMKRPWMQRFAFRAVSQINIQYRSSPLSKSLDNLPKTAPQAGDRFPWLRLRLSADAKVQDLLQALDDRRFHLLAFGQVVPEAVNTLAGGDLCLHAVPRGVVNDAALAAAGIPQPSFYLLRPDGYIGLAGEHLDAPAVENYLRERKLAGRGILRRGSHGDTGQTDPTQTAPRGAEGAPVRAAG